MTFTVVMSWTNLKAKVELGIYYSECDDGIGVYAPSSVPTTRGLFPIVYYALLKTREDLADFKDYVRQFPNRCTKGNVIIP